MDFDDFNLNYEVKCIDESNNSKDRWKIFLYKGLKTNLKKRFDEMISHSENQLFYAALKLEYGYDVNQNFKEAFLLYKESSSANSKNYLSMARLFDIYRTKDKNFLGLIENDKNLELIYLFKTFAYLPISKFNDNQSYKQFPFDLEYTIASFMDNNNLDDTKKILRYIDKLFQSKKYNDILSQDDCNLMKGFIEGYYEYQFLENNTNSINLLLALSLDGNSEAKAKLIYLYLEKLSELDKNDNKNINILKTKIYDLFVNLEEEKYYKIYSEYGLFLYHEMRMFDKALEIFEKGYKNHNYECSLYYFHAFTKSGNQAIYEQKNFNPKKFIDIFQCLIDAFIYGQVYSLYNMFEFLHILSKKYNLSSQLSQNYMVYLNEIALLCKSLADKEKGEENMKIFTNDNKVFKYGVYQALSLIYMYGLTTEVKLHLIKAEYFLKKSREKDEYSQPYYTRLIYKIKKKLFDLGVFEDKRELDKYENKVFELYNKYKNYEHYGNSYYYYFGRLYEKGIGTKINNEMAYKYFQKGCSSLHNLNDSFVIVYKRYLSLKIINSNKFKTFRSPCHHSFNVIFRLSIGGEIKLPIHDNMYICDAKNELYKRPELQNFVIKFLLFQGNHMQENDKFNKFKVKENDIIIVFVEKSNNSWY